MLLPLYRKLHIVVDNFVWFVLLDCARDAGPIMSLRKDGGMFILAHVDRGAGESFESGKQLRFCTGEANLSE